MTDIEILVILLMSAVWTQLITTLIIILKLLN